MRKAAKIALIAFLAGASVWSTYVIHSRLTYVVRIGGSGEIKAIGLSVFEDEALTTPLTSINWGLVEPGETIYKDIWVYNDGNYRITLMLTTDNWNPPNASDFMTLTWNYANQVIEPGAALGLTFSLYISSSITDIDTFSFVITVTGVG